MSERRRRDERRAERGDREAARRLRRGAPSSMDVVTGVGAVLRRARLGLDEMLRQAGVKADIGSREPLPGEAGVDEVADLLNATKRSGSPAALWTWGDPYEALSSADKEVRGGPTVVYVAVVDFDHATGEPYVAFGAAPHDFANTRGGYLGSGDEVKVGAVGVRAPKIRHAGYANGTQGGFRALVLDRDRARAEAAERSREYRDAFAGELAPFLEWARGAARGSVALDSSALEAALWDNYMPFVEDVTQLLRGRPKSGRGLYVVRVARGSKGAVIAGLRVMDPEAEVNEAGNPVTFWVRTRLVAEEIRSIPGVQDAARSTG